MRAVVDAKEFFQALNKVSRVLRKSKYTPALGEAMIRFTGGRCVLTGTDFDTWLTAEIPAYGDDFAFVFHRTANVAKACRRFDGELTMELTESGEGRSRQLKLCMSCGNRAGEFHAFFPEDYPEMPEMEPEHAFSANAASLLDRINRVRYAAGSPDPKRLALESCVQFNGNRLFCLDGLRAAWDADKALTVPVSFMGPVTSMEHLKVFGYQEVSVRLERRYVDITDGSVRLMFRRVETALYDLDCAIPTEFQEELYVSPSEFLTELAYLKELLPSKEKPYVCFDSGELLVQTSEFRYQTRVRVNGHSEIVIGFNLNYLADALRQFKGEPHVRMKLISPISPVVLEAEGRNDCAMVLPVRLKQAQMAA